MVNPILSEADHDRLEAAVAAAERGTTGEIVCVLTREASTYPEVAVAAGAVAALAPLPICLLLGYDPIALLQRLAGGWQVAHVAASPHAPSGLALFAALQILLFVAVTLLAARPPVRRLLTPGALRSARVKTAAEQQFLATGLAANAYRTGVVIFTSIHDRRVEIVADKAINQACGEAVWHAAVRAVEVGMRRDDPADGLIEAVRVCGEALARHFPSDGGGENTLVDRALEL